MVTRKRAGRPGVGIPAWARDYLSSKHSRSVLRPTQPLIQWVKRYSSPYNTPRRPRGGVQVQLYSFFNLGARWRQVVNATPRPLYPRDRPSTNCTGGWMGSTAGLDGCGKTRPQRDLFPGPSSPQRVAIPTELSCPPGCQHGWLRKLLTSHKNGWKTQ
jgi:hypothetical protein